MEYILSTTEIPNVISATVYADDVTGLPTRVEVRGISGKYRFIVSSPDRTRSFTTMFDSATVVSRNISNAVASRYTPEWQMALENI